MKTKYNICILLIILLFLLILYILLENKTIENMSEEQAALEFSNRFKPTDEDISGVQNEDVLYNSIPSITESKILDCVYDQSGDCENLKTYSPYTMLDFSSNDYHKERDISNDIQYFNNTSAILGNHFPYERVPKQFL